jgi:hypothetical protein
VGEELQIVFFEVWSARETVRGYGCCWTGRKMGEVKEMRLGCVMDGVIGREGRYRAC